jgi:hypothetical protein
MKLVYTLTGLATVLATGNQAFQLTTKNVQQLQNVLEDRVEQKYTNMKRQFRQKRGLFDTALDQLSSGINIDEYNDAAADCKIRTAGFWNDCRQCIAQQCSSYMATECGSSVPAPLSAELIANQLPEFLETSIKQAQDDYNRALSNFKMSRGRSKRSAESTLDCQQFVSASNNIEVKCVNYNEQPQPLNAADDENYPHTTDDAIFGNWKFTVQASHPHEMAEEGLNSDGAIQIKLSVVADSEEGDYPDYDSYLAGIQGNPTNLVKIDGDYYQASSAFERKYPAQSGENAECNGAGCMHLGGNQYNVETEFDNNFNGFKFDCDGNENANCNQMIMDYDMESIDNSDDNSAIAEKPCDGEGEPVEPITEVEDFLNSDSELTFCDQIGGCPDVPFVRRSSRDSLQRFNRAAKAQLCQKIESMPETCSLLGFNCNSCDRKISEECPEYHALRSELSQKISEASSLAEQFQFKTVRSLEQIKFLHALNVGGSKAIYVQSATKNGDNVDLSIRVGSPAQAVDVLVQAKIKSADEWPMVTKKVADKVAQLF